MDRSSSKQTCSAHLSKFLALMLLILVSGMSHAEVYFEVSIEAGGETLGSASNKDLNIAGGFKLAIGIQRYIGGFEDVGLLFSVGYLSDEIDASNGTAETDATVLEFIYFRKFGPHRIGTGGTYHLNPQYKENLDGFAKTKINFDDSTGLLVRYSYTITEGLQAGVRYTIMDYEANGESLDASSIGLFFSSSF